MAGRTYIGHSDFGKKIKQWLATADGDCPIAPCSLVVDPTRYFLINPDEVTIKNRDDLYNGPISEPSDETAGVRTAGDGVVAPSGKGPYKRAWTHADRMSQLFRATIPAQTEQTPAGPVWTPFHCVGKWDPLEHLFNPNDRERQMAALREAQGQDFEGDYQSWDGIVSNGLVVMEYVSHLYDEPHISEVSNAIYSHLCPGPHQLQYVFVHNIRNPDTRNFITRGIFDFANGYNWPPSGADVNRESIWHFASDTPEYEGLLGTRIGRMIGYWMLGRYPRGTCSIPYIFVALSGEDRELAKVIDMLFLIKPTKPPHPLPEVTAIGEQAAKKGADADPAPEPEPKPKPAAEPAFKPVPPEGGKPLDLAIAQAGPVPPEGGKPLEAALAAAGTCTARLVLRPPKAAAKAPTRAQLARRNRMDILKRKADEEEQAEAAERYGKSRKTRSGKQHKRDF